MMVHSFLLLWVLITVPVVPQPQELETPARARARFEETSVARQTMSLVGTPTDATVRGGGGSSGSPDHELVRYRLETNLTSPEVFNHYASGLQTLGWQPGMSQLESDFALQTWRFQDSGGTSWRAVLTISKSAASPGYQNLTLHLVRTPVVIVP
jgi:hypothetical protein